MSFIKANDRQFRERIKPGTLVQITAPRTKYYFHNKEQVHRLMAESDCAYSYREEKCWIHYLKETKANWLRASEYIMLLKAEPKWIAVPSKAWKESFTDYSQIWEVLWQGKTGYLRIKMDLGDSIDCYLEVVNNV